MIERLGEMRNGRRERIEKREEREDREREKGKRQNGVEKKN